MPEINISNSTGRDAVVTFESVTSTQKVRWLDPKGRQAKSIRVLKSNVSLDVDALQEKFGELSDVAQALIDGDPEVDIETIGSFLRNTSRVFVDQNKRMVHKVKLFDIIRNPDRSVRERRPHEMHEPNVSADHPISWSGRLIKKEEACRKFVFASKVQLTHINGLTYDFLFGMAKELHEADSLMLLGAGPKSNQPLIFRRGSLPFRGFLEGRVDGDRYCLVLHLSNMELRLPKDEDDDS